MSEAGDSDERGPHLPAVVDMARIIRKAPPDEARRLLAKWIGEARDLGHASGLCEGLARASRPVLRTTLGAILDRQRSPK